MTYFIFIWRFLWIHDLAPWPNCCAVS